MNVSKVCCGWSCTRINICMANTETLWLGRILALARPLSSTWTRPCSLSEGSPFLPQHAASLHRVYGSAIGSCAIERYDARRNLPCSNFKFLMNGLTRGQNITFLTRVPVTVQGNANNLRMGVAYVRSLSIDFFPHWGLSSKLLDE